VRLSVILTAWNEFWYSETSPLSVAVYRILLGLLMMAFVLLLIPDFFVYFGSQGICSNQAVADWVNGRSVFLNVLSFAPDNDKFLAAFHCFFFLAALSLTLGYKTRFAAAACFVCLTTLYHRDPFIFNSGDTYLRVSTFWLIFSASGEALSLDGRAKRANPQANFDNYRLVSIWPLRLLQLQLCTVYCHTFFCKIVGGPWIEGTAVFTSSRLEDLQRLPIPFIFENRLIIAFLSWSTLFLECSLWTLIWIKEFRYWVIAMAVIFHLTIDWTMNIPLFEYLMIISYVLFIDNHDLARMLTSLRKKLKHRV